MQASDGERRSIGVGRRNSDGVEAVLRRADKTLDEWFRQSRITTQDASVVFGRFLDRARREGAGALRQPVDTLQAGLGKLSASLKNIEHQKAVTRPKSRRPAARKPRAAASKRKKAA